MTLGRHDRRLTVAVGVHLGEHVDLLVLLVQQILEFPDLGFQGANTFLQRLGVSAWERASAEFVARAAFESDIGTLRAAGSDAVAPNLLAAAAVAGLGDTALRTRPHLDNLHGEDSGHLGGCFVHWSPFVTGLRFEFISRFLVPIQVDEAAVAYGWDERAIAKRHSKGPGQRVKLTSSAIHSPTGYEKRLLSFA